MSALIPDSNDTRLYGCTQSSGAEGMITWGPLPAMLAELNQRASNGRDVWLILPDGSKLLPWDDPDDGHKRVLIPASEQHCGIDSVWVRLRWRCPLCNEARGTPQDRLSYDGSRRLRVHGWDNACGHVDLYANLRKEAAQTEQAPPAPPPPVVHPWRVAFWEKVNRYAETCGGDTSASYGGVARMQAVAEIEALIAPFLLKP